MRSSLRWLALTGVLCLASSAGAQWVEPAQAARPLLRRTDALRARGAADESVLLGIEYLAGFEDRARPRSQLPWLARAERYLAAVEAGEDPYATEARGEITLRAYRSPLSDELQGYAVYVPPDYDPSRRYPLLVALHGGSSNANLFCALTLGARVPWTDYHDHWDVVHEPTLHPGWIVVAPEGFGNSMWRFLGERDALDVIEEVSRHYAVDSERVVLHGLSNGGLGSFNIGSRHAWRFSAVVPLAGAPGWVHYLGGHPSARELRVLRPMSGWHVFENARNTHFHAHHGHTDPGPMRPRYLSALRGRAEVLQVPFALDWYAAGHDLVGPVHRAGHVFEREAGRRRARSPEQVTLVTGDYRAARQHWIEVTRIADYPSMVRVTAERTAGEVIVRTRGAVIGLALHEQRPAVLRVDGDELRLTETRRVVGLVRGAEGWRFGSPPSSGKRPGLSGPLGDATFERLVHVYGTRDPGHIATLREAAEEGARGWIDNLRGVRQPVVADTELTDAMMERAHLVLYGSPRDNAVLARIADRLPIRIEGATVRVGGRTFVGRHLGTRFVYPNPLRPERYVIVAGAGRPATVRAGARLPAFLPDWVVYDSRRLPERPGNLPTARSRHIAAGFFDDAWRLRARANALETTPPLAPRDRPADPAGRAGSAHPRLRAR